MISAVHRSSIVVNTGKTFHRVPFDASPPDATAGSQLAVRPESLSTPGGKDEGRNISLGEGQRRQKKLGVTAA